MDIQRMAILLGLAVTTYLLILAWNRDYGQRPEPAPPPSVAADAEANGRPNVAAPAGTVSEDTDVAPPADIISEDTDVAPPADIISEDADVVPQLAEESRPAPATTGAARDLIEVQTDVLHLQIDPLGGDIVRISLPAYPASLETPDIPFLLLDPGNAYVAQSGLIGRDGTDIGGARPVFRADRARYVLGDAPDMAVSLTHRQETGVRIVKDFVFRRGDYLVDVNYRIINDTESPWRGGLFAQIKRDGQDPTSTSGNPMGLRPYVGGATRSGQEFYKKLEFDDIADQAYRLTLDEGYMAMVQHYFVSAWVPGESAGNTYLARKLKGRDIYLFGFTTPAITIPAGQVGVLAASYYAGPKDQYRLREIAEGLDLTVDYGFLWWLAQPLFYLLTMIHSVVANWGLAIIGLTIIVKLLLYPLSAASLRSMAKMRKLQPEMVRLKERYGDDRQKFSEAMMQLYKKEGANPLGGCFPILLQMPVFLALYWTLMESVELRQAPFFLWVHDLSAMDPYFILPILMGISMYLTQLMQPEPPDPMQARIFKLMPIMFTFFFLWFPSGLVLYWLVNNILSILQQWYVTRQVEKAA